MRNLEQNTREALLQRARSPMVRRWGSLFLALILLFSLGYMLLRTKWQIPEENDQKKQDRFANRIDLDVLSTENTLPSIPGVKALEFDKHLAPLIKKLEPQNDDWESETISAAIAGQLERLANILQHPTNLTAENIAPLVVENISLSRLRPQPLHDAFSDSTIVVRRIGELKKQSGSELHFSSVEGMISAANELLLPLQHAEEIHLKFKVIQVRQNKNSISTSVYYQAGGRTSSGGVQQNATWNCLWEVSDDSKLPLLTEISVENYEEVLPGSVGGIKFQDWTAAVLGKEVSFRQQMTKSIDYWRGRLQAAYGVDPNGNQGIAIGDVNGDKLEDIYVCQQGGQPNRLYMQNIDGTLRDVSSQAGVDLLEISHSALLIDLDNDGDQDLVISQGWYFMILSNDGSGKFQRRIQAPSSGNILSMTAADYDNDGDLDLFFCGRNPSREKTDSESILGTPIPYHDANNGGLNMLLRNDGRRFVDVTVEVGLDQNNRRYSYAASWEDYDNDGDQDLYVANDFGRNNLYRNDSGKFIDVAAELGVEDISAGMSVTWGDYDNDGLMDLYVSNMFSSAGNRIAYQRRFHQNSRKNVLSHFRRHARGNTLFKNMGTDGFTDVSVPAAVTRGRWAWGAKFADLNNDGFEDLYVGNGFITTDDTGDL